MSHVQQHRLARHALPHGQQAHSTRPVQPVSSARWRTEGRARLGDDFVRAHAQVEHVARPHVRAAAEAGAHRVELRGDACLCLLGRRDAAGIACHNISPATTAAALPLTSARCTTCTQGAAVDIVRRWQGASRQAPGQTAAAVWGGARAPRGRGTCRTRQSSSSCCLRRAFCTVNAHSRRSTPLARRYTCRSRALATLAPLAHTRTLYRFWTRVLQTDVLHPRDQAHDPGPALLPLRREAPPHASLSARLSSHSTGQLPHLVRRARKPHRAPEAGGVLRAPQHSHCSPRRLGQSWRQSVQCHAHHKPRARLVSGASPTPARCQLT